MKLTVSASVPSAFLYFAVAVMVYEPGAATENGRVTLPSVAEAVVQVMGGARGVKGFRLPPVMLIVDKHIELGQGTSHLPAFEAWWKSARFRPRGRKHRSGGANDFHRRRQRRMCA